MRFKSLDLPKEVPARRVSFQSKSLPISQDINRSPHPYFSRKRKSEPSSIIKVNNNVEEKPGKPGTVRIFLIFIRVYVQATRYAGRGVGSGVLVVGQRSKKYVHIILCFFYPPVCSRMKICALTYLRA